ncbi:cryptochrome/photolyase family protein [Stieleria varia]|uniref:Deoxyribodipyrimidine photo-lyase-related protein n=1 Tax=Stieleria varia TaxID=2528005 RepID=A0A5C6B9X3_9BACT|nr:cryptochrome/photolyase family protein [Stieleria varia]TWU08129.1 Deoxyribodipyrimidine photo-lyase-related protein [Stieleria varia]
MILLILPHQLFARHPGLELSPSRVLLLEESLFFADKRYPAKFHKQKLWLHRATMKRYEQRLSGQGFDVNYVEYDKHRPGLKEQLERVVVEAEKESETLAVVDPTDFVMERRLRNACRQMGMGLEILPNPGFLNTTTENQEYRDDKQRWFMADFYKWQRKRLDLLMNGDEPEGDRWSFDESNRRKVPKKMLASIPKNLSLSRDGIDHEAIRYVEANFPDHPGSLDRLHYPTSEADANEWLQHFLSHRFANFGDYEDAIVEGESWLWHSVLTPMLNTGLLTPDEVVNSAVKHARSHGVPINSLEGFIRQIIGWREFMRATYEDLGVKMRTTNHWQHHRSMPQALYDAATGIDPVDDTIRRILDTGYCHHIERLMILGGFMFLCEIDPDDIYLWFMEMFIDSYDWVMVPNVYAMSQHADGGLITTKPYFSGSSYVRKMSHYGQGSWCEIWDGLYWRWIWNHVDELSKNHRWAMACSMVKKMDSAKRDRHIANAESFLANHW